MEDKVEDLRKLQLIELDILKEFIDVCKKLNLRYFLAGGSILGAVRHGGFIPWDDDIDVMMPRKDYEVFLENAQSLMQKKYFLQTYKTDPEYVIGFAKIRNSETTFIENSTKNLNINHGVYIDIFPIDGFKPKRILKKLKNKLVFEIYRIYFAQMYCIRNPERIKIKVMNLINKILKNTVFRKKTLVDLLHKEKKIATEYDFDESEYACLFFDAGIKPMSCIFPHSYFGKGTVKSFEGIDVIVPQDYDGFLKQQYGNYMELPPEEKRVSHHYNQVVDLEKSYIYYTKANKE